MDLSVLKSAHVRMEASVIMLPGAAPVQLAGMGHTVSKVSQQRPPQPT